MRYWLLRRLWFPEPFGCGACGCRVAVQRMLVQYGGVMAVWVCPTCGIGGWGTPRLFGDTKWYESTGREV